MRGQAPALFGDARGGAIVLFEPTALDLSQRFMKLDQDGVFRDGFEAGG